MSCRYCVPEESLKCIKERSDLLSFEEITKIVQTLSGMGIKRIKVTGGEPLIKRGITSLIKGLAAISGIEDISLTTNGQLLSGLALDLKRAGLSRINVSLDSLNSEKYNYLSRGGDLALAFEGIKKAIEVGMSPVKMNVVAIKGVNDFKEDILDFLSFTRELPVYVRFIEHMTARVSHEDEALVPTAKIKEIVESEVSLEEMAPPIGGGPAKYYKPAGYLGGVGFISAMSDSFCQNCNRLRLSATGTIKSCLFSCKETDIITPLRGGASDEKIKRIITELVASKPKDRLGSLEDDCDWQMLKIGG